MSTLIILKLIKSAFYRERERERESEQDCMCDMKEFPAYKTKHRSELT